MSKNALLMIVIVLLIAVIVLAIIFFGNKEQKEETGEPTQSEEEANLEEINVANEIYGVSGEIKTVEGDVITIKALIPVASDEEAAMATLKVKVTDSTEIVKLQIPEGGDEFSVPEKVALSLEDLKTGDKIDIIAAENIAESVKNQTEFTAGTINVVE